jgi:hypothetical protein
MGLRCSMGTPYTTHTYLQREGLRLGALNVVTSTRCLEAPAHFTKPSPDNWVSPGSGAKHHRQFEHLRRAHSITANNMDFGRSTTPQGHRSSSARRMYRRDSNRSSASFVSEVEMAQDEVFAGPMSESVPTSVSSFHYQRPRQRQGSISSFTYFQEDAEPPEWSDEEAVVDESDEENEYTGGHGIDEPDLETGDTSPFRRKSPGRSRTDQPLLTRIDSTKSDTREHDDGGNFSQKLYIVSEDLTMVIAGFQTSKLGFSIYLALCIITGGLAYLLFRWLPRWQMRLVASPAPLRSCTFVVVEVSSWLNRKWATSPTKDKNPESMGRVYCPLCHKRVVRAPYVHRLWDH